MRQKVAEEHVCATSAYNPSIAMVHHHSITAFGTESCFTLGFVASHREGVATTMAVTTGGSIP